MNKLYLMIMDCHGDTYATELGFSEMRPTQSEIDTAAKWFAADVIIADEGETLKLWIIISTDAGAARLGYGTCRTSAGYYNV